MSTEPESFLARWSRRKRAAEREAVRPADGAAELPTPSTKVGGQAAAGDAPVSAAASAGAPAPMTEVPLPPIESLDGLRSDYEAFFQQPVDDELRHAALKKLFADPHFNQMDMLDVYVDDYTQFEPLPAALRMRLPSARSFLSDSERAAVEAAEAPTGATDVAPGLLVTDPGARTGAAAGADADVEQGGVAADVVSGSPSRLAAAKSTVPAAAAEEPHIPMDVSSPHATQPGKSTASDSSSS